MSISSITLAGGLTFANDQPLTLIGGMNVIEDRDTLLRVAEHMREVTRKLGIGYVFKASFDKANRSSIHSYRGPGLDEGLRLLAEVKQRFGVPILTDVHEPDQAASVAEIADIIQLPAFLARQTDLVVAMARTGAVINIKKPQFLAPLEMRHIITKCREIGNENILLCERGSHALQKPGGQEDSADGRGAQVDALARAGVAVGIAGLFLEVHPDPVRAKCDGRCALPLENLETFLRPLLAIDAIVKG
jgi:2-dehydro-3-deoxyphosphooctonate aldolase (KDO 8-P synthase)